MSPAGTGTVDVTVSTYGGTSLSSPADVFTYSLDGPQVTSVQRYGFHAQPTYLVINFNSPLDPSPAQNVSNYQIVGPIGPPDQSQVGHLQLGHPRGDPDDGPAAEPP